MRVGAPEETALFDWAAAGLVGAAKPRTASRTSETPFMSTIHGHHIAVPPVRLGHVSAVKPAEIPQPASGMICGDIGKHRRRLRRTPTLSLSCLDCLVVRHERLRCVFESDNDPLAERCQRGLNPLGPGGVFWV